MFWFILCYFLFILFYFIHDKLIFKILGSRKGIVALFVYFMFFVCISFHFISVDFITRPGARRAPQGVGGLAILFYLYDTHQVLVELPQGVGSLVILFVLFVVQSIQFS